MLVSKAKPCMSKFK